MSEGEESINAFKTIFKDKTFDHDPTVLVSLDVDVRTWLQDQMVKMLQYETLVVDGNAIFGENGFWVVETLTGHWYMRPKKRTDEAIIDEWFNHDHDKCCPYLLCAHPKCCGYRLKKGQRL